MSKVNDGNGDDAEGDAKTSDELAMVPWWAIGLGYSLT
jgi:hypothetical protein